MPASPATTMRGRLTISARRVAAPNSRPSRRAIWTRAPRLKPLPLGTLYTCPMHPEIVQDGPGACPICGMALEPMGVPPDDEQQPRARRHTRRLAVGVPLSLALVALDMSRHLFGVDLLPVPVGPRPAMAATRSRHPGGAVVRLAVLRARLASRSAPAASTCSRSSRSAPARPSSTASSPPSRPALFPAAMRDAHGTVPRLFRGGGRHHCRSCCSARCSSCARGCAPAAPSAPCSISRPRRRCACSPAARPRPCRSPRSRRRHPARPPGRQDPHRRHRRRGQKRGR